jgi:hypothetical protein
MGLWISKNKGQYKKPDKSRTFYMLGSYRESVTIVDFASCFALAVISLSRPRRSALLHCRYAGFVPPSFRFPFPLYIGNPLLPLNSNCSKCSQYIHSAPSEPRTLLYSLRAQSSVRFPIRLCNRKKPGTEPSFFHRGWLSGIEPESGAPQTPVLTVTP